MSEITSRQDKGRAGGVAEWLRRVDGDRPFLFTEERVWTYGEALAEVERRWDGLPRLSIPRLGRAASVFDVLAGLSGGGVTVAGPGSQPAAPADADLVVYTSGTSGEPKGVRLTLANLEAAAEGSAAHLGHDEGDNWLLAVPLHHVAGLSILVRQAHAGGSVTMLGRFEPAAFAAALRGPVTMASAVSTMLRRVLAVDSGRYRGLRAVLVGGGPVPGDLLQEAGAAGLPVLPTYGMTETFGQVATLLPGSPLARRAHPLPNVEIRIEGDGRIAVKGPQVSPGYVGEPDRSDPWLVTGDLGALDEDGALRVLGRADGIIVTGGINVDPGTVEAALTGHPDVIEAVVMGVPDQEWGSLVACLYEGDVPAAELVGWARERLPSHMVPKRWRVVEHLPRTALGKPDRSVGRQILES